MIFAALEKAGIKHNLRGSIPQGGVTVQMDCPRKYCKEDRQADDKTPLKVSIANDRYAEWRCRHCLWSGSIGEKPEPEEAAADDIPIAAPKAAERLPSEALEFLAVRGLSEQDAATFKLGWDGRRKCIKIPYIEGGNVINHAFVRISDGASKLEKTDHIRFFGLGELKNCSDPTIIAQRELDALVLKARGLPQVIAVPNGGRIERDGDDFDREPDRFAYLSAISETAKAWGEVKFAFDDSKEGLALKQELARRLGPGRCAAAKLSRGTVSATMLELGPDALCADIHEAKKLPIFGLYEVEDFERELAAYYEYGMNSGVSTGWPNVDKIYTVVGGQLTVVTGIPNSGKSEWLDALCVNLAENFSWRIGAFSPENGKEAHVMKLVEKKVLMSADPKARERMSFDTMVAGSKWVGKHFCFIESKDEMPTLDWILERATDAVLRYGIKGLVIDPWNRIERKGAENQSETDYVRQALPKILRFAVNYGVHVWLVVHPKQQMKDKNGKIPPPSLYDMAGSAHFVNMADNGIVVHRSESIDDTTELLVRKVRFKHVGRRGETKLKYIRTTGRYEPLDEALTPQQAKEAEKYKAASGGDDDAIQTWEVNP